MSNLPGAAINIPTAAVEAGSNTESSSSGIEKSVESAISSGNAPALVQAGTQLTQAATQSIQAIAKADPNEAHLPEQGVIGAIATQANGLAQEAHRAYVNSISEILQSRVEEPPAPIVENTAEEPVTQVADVMPGFEPRPSTVNEVPSTVEPNVPEKTEMMKPPSVEVQLVAIAAQVYLDERVETEKILTASQPNYEGHSIRTAVPYYEAVLAQDPSDQQWQAFVAALKLESTFYETKLQRANVALEINELQNQIEDNRKHNILPTAEQAENLKHLQQQFEQLNSEVSHLEQEKAHAEEQYQSTQ
ncbi:MAG: hypothetical protein KC585_02110 [Candidatus Magasanikbacteria bacterium]|nr:hypothetical protein [Candidatus Magasanikbacteria bacterium]